METKRGKGEKVEHTVNIIPRLIGKINKDYLRFGVGGVVTIAVAKVLQKPIIMKVHPRCLAHPLRLRTRTSDLRVYEEVIVNRQYECDLPRQPRVIVDAGANIGLASIYFVTRYPDAQIFAIEPETENFHLLQENVKPYKNIRPIQAALWSKETRVDMKDKGLEPWGFQAEEDSAGTVRTITLSGFLRQNSISELDVLKMDIEGAEREVFAGAPDWVSRVGTLMIELHDQFKVGCSQTVYAAMTNRKAWKKGEVTFFGMQTAELPRSAAQ